MSTDVQTNLSDTQTASSKSQTQDFVRRKINRTRRSVKLAELAAGLLLFSAGSLLFLLALVIVDHWIVGLSFSVRLISFLLYIAAAGAFMWIYVAPLLFHSINPLYAARMIEQGQPSLKNSLLNFLFLSQNQQGTRKAVLDAVEHQAANDISSLSLEHLVDYTKAIRVGYVLAALAVIFGLYTVLSPKDPLQTAARIAMPWNDIARPSRVEIIEILPGDATIYQGDQLPVTVKLQDVTDGDRLELIFSTNDGQLVDQVIPLQISEDGFHYEAVVATSETGIQHDLTYRIEAGDAVSRNFDVTALEAPSIDISTLRYDYPSYTGEAAWEQQGDGHIRALEGTMVTIHAISNRPIKNAYVEFDPVADSPIVSLNTVTMQVDREESNRASVRFPLELNEAGAAGKFRSYQIRFRTEDGVLNPHPVLYNIDVLRDLAPEIEFVEPAASEIQLPENQPLNVRFRAIDPDFGIRQIRAVGFKPGEDKDKPSINISLLKQPKSGQVLQDWKFVPSQHKLRSGDVVTLIGVAEDTRTNFDGTLRPNVSETRIRKIRIIDPLPQNGGDNNQQNQAGGQNDQQPEQSLDQKNDANPMNKDQQGGQGDKSDSKSGMGDSQDMSDGNQGEQNQGEQNQDNQSGSKGNSGEQGMKGQSDKPQEGNQQDQQQESGQGGSSSNQEGQGENQQKQPGQGGSESNEPNQSGQPQKGQPQSGQGGQGQQNQDGNQDNMSQPESSGGQGGNPSAASDKQDRQNNQGDQTGQPNGTGTGKAGDPNQGGELQKGDSSTKPNENSTVERQQDKVASDGAEDADAFQRIKDYLDKKKQEQQQNGSPQNGNQNDSPQPGEGQSGGKPMNKPEANQDPAGANSDQNNKTDGNKADGQENPQNQAGGAGGDNNQPGEKPEEMKSQDNKTGNKDGTKPETAADENATDGQKQEGEPGSGERNQGEAPNRDTQNMEKGAGDTKGGAKQEEPNANPSADSEKSGDTGKGDTTDSGAGKKANEGDTGSPESSEKPNKQSENKMEPDDASSDQQGDQPKSPSNSDKQSESKGDSQGDQSGGGGAGGGQAAKQAGNDSPGSTSAADEGAGTANQEGMGETSDKGGDGPQADKQTGSQSDQMGEGSGTANSPQGNQPGEQPSSAENSPENPGNQKNDPKNGSRGPGNSPTPEGGGKPSDTPQQKYTGKYFEPGEDAANLNYARKATDMVLDELKHQQNPDQEMLDELGWTKEEYQRFLQRWQSMKQAAKSDDQGAKEELDDALRSLGLSPGKDTTRRVEKRDAATGGSGDNQRSLPPAAFLEQYRAYLKGASQ
ncbi:hypothetical protein GC197_06515 [bacterium]|nr:hypothetical protein [bacterium]